MYFLIILIIGSIFFSVFRKYIVRLDSNKGRNIGEKYFKDTYDIDNEEKK